MEVLWVRKERGKRNSFSFPTPHSSLLSLLPGQGRPLGLGSCPPKATRLGRGAGPRAEPLGWQEPGGDPEPPAGRAGYCISALITVSPSVILFTVAERGHPSLCNLPLPAKTSQAPDGGNSESGWARSSLAVFSNSGLGERGKGRGAGGRGRGAGGRGPTLNLGTDSSSSLFLVQIPTTRGSSTISTGRLLDICGEEAGGGAEWVAWSHSPGTGASPPPFSRHLSNSRTADPADSWPGGQEGGPRADRTLPPPPSSARLGGWVRAAGRRAGYSPPG